MARNALLAMLLLVLASGAAMAIDSGEDLGDPEQQARYEKITREVRCLVCQNQTVADSTAPLAADLRREIRGMVEAGKSESDIETFLVERYGDFVLYRPRFTVTNGLLWLAPLGLLLLGGFTLWRVVRRRARLPIPPDENPGAAADAGTP